MKKYLFKEYLSSIGNLSQSSPLNLTEYPSSTSVAKASDSAVGKSIAFPLSRDFALA